MTFSSKVLDGELDLLAIQATNTDRFPFFLDSAAHGATFELDDRKSANNTFHKKDNALGQFSLLFAYPQQTLILDDNFRLHSLGQNAKKTHSGFLNELDKLWRQAASHTAPSSELQGLPFRGGWFLFLAYELANEIEPILELENSHQKRGTDLPTAFATRIPLAIIVDHVLHQTTVIAETGFENEYTELLDLIENKRYQKLEKPTVRVKDLIEEDPEIYLDAINKTHNYLLEGDIFQANLSREWQTEVDQSVNPATLYNQLRTSNPGPFAGLVYYKDHVIMSSSPERLLRIENRKVSTRPIAGTRSRNNAKDDDQLIREELIKHPKERAEHIMLIDLERNDLGRISAAGSVHVDELMVIESYEHVHHIVSNVCGTLREDVSPGMAIRAVFPGGTITGCPKVRCMQIIAELEHKPREAYTGSIGYLNHNGDMDLNILIRTMHLHKNKLSFRAGGGIVFDSDPEKEVLETRAKARGLICSLQSGDLVE